jgi:hypothetical protein
MSAGLVLNRTRQVPAEDTPAFGAIAERFRRGGDLERAVALCRDGLAKFPNHMSARVTLGWALLDMGKYDEAQAELEQVLRRAPDNLAAIRGLAQLHERAENAVMLPLDGPGAWPPEPETIETAAAASSAAVEAAALEQHAKADPRAESTADLIVTGRAPAVDVPKEFAPVALTSPAEMAAPAAAEVSAPALDVPPPADVSTPVLDAAKAPAVEAVREPAPEVINQKPSPNKSATGKRAGFLPIQIEPSRVVRPVVFESIVDEEMPAPSETPTARKQLPQRVAQTVAPATVEARTTVDAPVAEAAVVEAPIVEQATEAHAAVAPVHDSSLAEIAIVTPQAEPSALEPVAVLATLIEAPVVAESALVEPAVAEPVVVEPVAFEPVMTVSAMATSTDDAVMPGPSTFALASEPIVDEPVAALGLTGFAGADFALEPVLDDYVPPPADEPVVSEFALSADAPELQPLLSLEDAAQPFEHAEAQPMLEAIVDEPLVAAQMPSEPVVEPVAQAAVEDDPLAFRLTEPVAMDVAAEAELEASAEEVAVVPEGVLAFDFETPAPVVVEVKPVLAEVVPIAARREAARLVALERFLSRVESRRLTLSAQPLAG